MGDIKGPLLLYPLRVIRQCVKEGGDPSVCLSLPENDVETTDDALQNVDLQQNASPEMVSDPCLTLVKNLVIAAQDHDAHFTRLDTVLSSLLPRALHCYPNQMKEQSEDDADIARVAKLLHRLPRTPQNTSPLSFGHKSHPSVVETIGDRIQRDKLQEGWFVKESRSRNDYVALPPDCSTLEAMRASGYNSQSMWNDLVVTNYIDTNSIVIAIHSTICKEKEKLPVARSVFKYIQTLAALQETYGFFRTLFLLSDDAIKLNDDPEKLRTLKNSLSEIESTVRSNPVSLQIVEIFLSVAWHRSVMIHFYMIAGVQLYAGPSTEWSDLYSVAGTEALRELSDPRIQGEPDYRDRGTTQYLCNWSLELLRRTKPARALDLRRMLNRFSCQFEHEPGRCLKASSKTCKGDDPTSCERFTAAETLTQSAHSHSCSGNCQRIIWNESSYLAVLGPRAVRIGPGMNQLFYQPASSRTLAISHVWAHGQGGRPEHGINTCLHRRYCGLARRLNCDSYWIDSACIPSDSRLRKEAIRSINDVFSTSGVVVVSDKDLQSVDISTSSISTLETALSVLLLCDWNVRAWTALEAIQANRSIHILCSGDTTIQLSCLLQRIWEDGPIDVAVLAGSLAHLLVLPHETSTIRRGIEEAGHLLSQRHASHLRDDVIIWALLNNNPTCQDAIDLWTTQTHVRTAFLVSSAPRIRNYLGFSWAPATPKITPIRREININNRLYHFTIKYHSGYDGSGSCVGTITVDGLRSQWLFLEITSDILQRYKESYNEYSDSMNAAEILQGDPGSDEGIKFPPGSIFPVWPDIDLSCKTIESFLQEFAVRVIKPVSTDGVSAYYGSDMGDYFTDTAAICIKKADERFWKWVDVFQWYYDVGRFEWRTGEMLIA